MKLPSKLDECIEALVGRGITTFRTGGALGFDTLAALKVLEDCSKDRQVLIFTCHSREKAFLEDR